MAAAWVNQADSGLWLTFTGIYNFPGYTVVDENDYLEIDFYGQTAQGPAGNEGYMQVSIDDSSLPLSEQTRIEAH